MPRTCTICADARVAEVDRQLVSGTSLRNIAEQFGLAVSSLQGGSRSPHDFLAVAAFAPDHSPPSREVEVLDVEGQHLVSPGGGFVQHPPQGLLASVDIRPGPEGVGPWIEITPFGQHYLQVCNLARG